LAKENGGNAAAAVIIPTETDSSTAVSATALEEKKPELAGNEQKSSKPEATGEEYVKSSGLAADGGDFDVTKPGAGLEADRKFYTLNKKDIPVRNKFTDHVFRLNGTKGHPNQRRRPQRQN
jgi:hypothetical protein